ncbi:DUF998 domain-containing protein [Amycolatopsis cynarae]|uniref:DUF998 domain-containing protein n=1 Tax=Amycolatopsis cynarae TaxID=2995223 RepID=A0ABY7BAT5_9PSEU|nr:DUF998 domain-containing protein [Amycolatopsis sp. HUAS 11-8]WAL69469.1 DUF998 domain-containing protein [Amycolatopsis sp. HUAS 11-8]
MSATLDGTAAAPPTRRSRVPAILGMTGLAALAAGAALILLLQFLPPTSRLSAIRLTISEYGLTANKAYFDVAVILVALGSALLFVVHLLHGTLRALSAATLLATVWTVSLLVIVAFPKTNWAMGPSAGGTVHRIASVAGFLCLPVAILAATGQVFPRAGAWRRTARLLGAASLAWFGVIIGAAVLTPASAGPWWAVLPLGLVERLLAVTELLSVATLAVPLLRSQA